MVAIALVDARPQVASPGSRTRRRPAVAMMVVGIVAAAAAVGGAVGGGPSGPVAPAYAAVVDPGVTTSERDITVVTQVYEPGQSSGWHRHAGVHAVAVLSGTLTVYDDECRAVAFGPGNPYVGGRQLHLARNEGDVAVEMVVTYISPVRAEQSTRPGQAPSGCGSDPSSSDER